jgi:hypothetical protein
LKQFVAGIERDAAQVSLTINGGLIITIQYIGLSGNAEHNT